MFQETTCIPWGFDTIPSAPLSAVVPEVGCSRKVEEPGCISGLCVLYIDNFAVLSCDGGFAGDGVEKMAFSLSAQGGDSTVDPPEHQELISFALGEAGTTWMVTREKFVRFCMASKFLATTSR